MSRPAAKSITHQREVSSYERLVRRINASLTSPLALIEKQANLMPSEDDSAEDWQRLLEEIELADGVTMTKRQDGSVHVRWSSSAIQ